MNRRDFTLGSLAASLSSLVGGLLAKVAMAKVPSGPPEERDFGGVARLITIGIPADSSPYWPKMVIGDNFGNQIELVQGLELSLDTSSMLFKGHITRVAHDRVRRDDKGVAVGLVEDGKLKLVREPVVVLRFETLPLSNYGADYDGKERHDRS